MRFLSFANRRLSFPVRPGSPAFPGRCDTILSHWAWLNAERFVVILNVDPPWDILQGDFSGPP